MKKSAHHLEKHRKNLWQELQPTLKETPAFTDLAGSTLHQFPIINPSQMRKDIEQYNSLKITHQQALRAAKNSELNIRDEIYPDVIAGFSTGTSGNRGIFITSQKERAIYLGQNIAKLLSFKSLFSGIKIMLFLRANNPLYSDSQKSKLFRYQYCSLALSANEKIKAIQQFKPNILIAPSHVLHELASYKLNNMHLTRCFFGAEPMGDIERKWIEHQIGIRPDSIYQATEGFLAFSCSFGQLHLNEDSFEIEFEPVKGTQGYRIIVTDLLRKTQPIIRVRLDDFIELDPKHCQKHCNCGFAGRTILPIAGRIQDLWHFPHQIITPRQVTNIIESTLGASSYWEIIASASTMTLFVEKNLSQERIDNTVHNLTTNLNLQCPITIKILSHDTITTKRHRVKWEDNHA